MKKNLKYPTLLYIELEISIFSHTQSLLIKSRNQHALEMEAQTLYMTFIPHHIEFLINCNTMA